MLGIGHLTAAAAVVAVPCANSMPDLSFSYSDNPNRSSAILSHLDIANNTDDNALTMANSASQASRTSLADVVQENAIIDR